MAYNTNNPYAGTTGDSWLNGGGASPTLKLGTGFGSPALRGLMPGAGGFTGGLTAPSYLPNSGVDPSRSSLQGLSGQSTLGQDLTDSTDIGLAGNGGAPSKPGGLGQWGGLAGAAAGGLLQSAFGGHGSDFGAGGYEATAGHYATGIGDAGERLTGMGGQELTNYTGDDATARAARENYARMLQTNPGTSQADAALLAQGAGRTAAAYTAARNHLSSALNQSGMDTVNSSGPSAQMAGGQAALAGQAANQYGQQANQLAYYRMNQARQNQMDLYNLRNGAAQQDYSNGLGFYGQGTGDLQNAFGDYNDLYKTALSKAQAQAGSSPWGAIGQGIGMVAAGGF